MSENALSKMSRKELLELLLEQISEKEKIYEQISALETQIFEIQKKYERKLADRRLDISKSGTMAEAALRLNKVFEDADLAVQQYQENIKRSSESAEAQAKAIREEAEAILAAAKSEAEKTRASAELIAQTESEKARQAAEKIIMDAKEQAIRTRREADEYQKAVTEKMTELYSSFKGLQAIIEVLGDKVT